MTPLQVAELKLRRAGDRFKDASLSKPNFPVMAFRELKRAAVRYTREALKAQTEAWFAENSDRDNICEFLDDLLTMGDL
jgi:hypothetical protein